MNSFYADNSDTTFGLNRRVGEILDALVVPADERAFGVAVSGGSDSTALLALCADWARLRGSRVYAVTLDHGLRSEAAEEARQVGAFARRLGVPHTILEWRPEGAVSQASAREARHRYLATWAADAGVSHLALGHTADDRIETLLIRARAGSGWYGLAAPQPVSASPVWPEGRDLRLIRPLLSVSRADLRRYLSSSGMSWIEDPTNDDASYERVRMRQLASVLSDAGRCAALKAADRLMHLRAARTAQLRQLSQTAVDWRVDGSAVLDLARCDEVLPETRFRLLQNLLLAVSGEAVPPPLTAVDALIARLERDRSATLGGAWLERLGDDLDIVRAPRGGARTPTAPEISAMTLNPGDAKVWDGRFHLTSSPNETPRSVLSYDDAQRAGMTLIGGGEVAHRMRRTLPVLVAEGVGHVAGLQAAETPANAGFFARALHRDRIESLLTDPRADLLTQIGRDNLVQD